MAGKSAQQSDSSWVNLLSLAPPMVNGELMSQAKIRVLLVDDIADTRENMKKLLFFEDDIDVVGSAGTGEEGIALAKELLPDVVIMDINMPGIDGITAAGILSRELPAVQIIMMSVQG